MRTKSPELMTRISSYVDQYYSEKHTVPSTGLIARGTGVAKATVHRYLVVMNDLGMLSYDGCADGRTRQTPQPAEL